VPGRYASAPGKVCGLLSDASGQVQRAEIDVGFVELGAGRGTTAVSAKPPGVRIVAATGANTTRATSSSARARACMISLPAVATTKFATSRSFPAKFLLHPYHATNASYPRGGRYHIAQMRYFCCCSGVTSALLGGEHRRMHFPRGSVNKRWSARPVCERRVKRGTPQSA